MSSLREKRGRYTCSVIALPSGPIARLCFPRATRLEEAAVTQDIQNSAHTVVDRQGARVDAELRRKGLLVRIADARELGDLAGDGLLVKALHVSFDALVEGGRDVHFDEIADQLAGCLARLAEGRDRGDE